MKRLFALMLAAALALSLTACGKEDPPAASSSGGSASGSSGGTGSVSEPDVPDVPDVSVEEHGDGPAVVVDYAPENLPGEEIDFREEATEFDQAIVLRAETDVLGVRFFVVDYPADGGPETEGEALFTYDELKKGEELVIVTSFPGDMASRGVSFDLGGQHEAYSLTTSGEDGSLMMTPMGGVVPGY